MTAFPNWQTFIVPQRNTQTGCIPWTHEILLRAHGATAVNFSTFQDDFDLDLNLAPGASPQNNFQSVANAINTAYPSIRFQQRTFSKGQHKLDFVENRIAQQKPTVVSLSQIDKKGVHRGWHMMIVVDANATDLYLLHSVNPGGSPNVVTMTKSDFVHLHDNHPGGDDVAFLS